MQNNKQFYSVSDMATILGYQRMTIYRYIWCKRLKAYRVGKEYRVAHSEFKRFMDERRYNY